LGIPVLFPEAKFHLTEARLILGREPETKSAQHEQSARHPADARRSD
jgi:hypothetical protein